MAVVYYGSKGLANLCFRVFGRWEVRGVEGVPPRGRLLVVANHLSNADPPALIAALPRRLRLLAKAGLFSNPLSAAYFHALAAYPAERSGKDFGALRWMLRCLEQEEAVAIFPEGTRGADGMRKVGRGVAYLAMKTGTTILPVGITGTENVRSLWRLPFPFCRLSVNIGQPFSLPPIDGNLSNLVLDSLADMIMIRIAGLLPPKYRGVYGSEAIGARKA